MVRGLVTLLYLFLLTGCAARVAGFRTVVSPNCLTAPLLMKDCNTTNGSTRCREVVIKYRESCAQIQVKPRNPAR